jgi:hypothetical protein
VLPLLIVGGQILLGTSGVASTMWTNPNVLASVAFGLAAYSMSMSAFQTLNSEGQALWLLYTFPCSIEEVLKDKAKLWGVLTLFYPLVLFAIGAFVAPSIGWTFLGAMLTALLGIPIYAFIAVALGVFGSNPLEQQPNQKVKPAYVYLYMTLSALYIYAIVTPQPCSDSSSWCCRCCSPPRCGRRRAISSAICSTRMPRRRRESPRPTD